MTLFFLNVRNVCKIFIDDNADRLADQGRSAFIILERPSVRIGDLKSRYFGNAVHVFKTVEQFLLSVRHAKDEIGIFYHLMLELARLEFGKIDIQLCKALRAVLADTRTPLRKDPRRRGIDKFDLSALDLRTEHRFRHGTAAGVARAYKQNFFPFHINPPRTLCSGD